MCKSYCTRLMKLTLAAFLIGLLGLTINAYSQPQPKDAGPDDAQKEYSNSKQKKCMACHLAEYQGWKKQKHSKTYDKLSANYKEDKTCLPCHTTGFGAATGFKNMTDTPHLANVTCEACHGPGAEHIKIGEEMAAKEKKDPAYGNEKKPSDAWKKDSELHLKAIKRLEVPGLTLEKGKLPGTKTNVHDAFDSYKNSEGQKMSKFVDACKVCHTMENGKKVHPEYKK
jgi:hypothetical protein